MIAQGDASNIASNLLGQREKQSLLAMKALIERHLKEMEEVEETGEGVGGEKLQGDVDEVGGEKLQGDVDVEMEL
jgi:hypothetical protein